jgi:hypothetical protein
VACSLRDQLRDTVSSTLTEAVWDDDGAQHGSCKRSNADVVFVGGGTVVSTDRVRVASPYPSLHNH